MESPDARSEYARRLQERTAARVQLDRSHWRLGSVRLLILAAAGAVVWAAWGPGWIRGWWLLPIWVAFLWIGGRMGRIEATRSRLTRAIALYERASERLDGRWPGSGRAGTRFLPEEHLYARDLDLFGEASLFELLCAARTGIGQATLAEWLLDPAMPETVAERQQAVAELRPELDLREDLAILGEDAGDDVHPRALTDWGERPSLLDGRLLRPLARGLAAIGVAALVGLVLHLAVLAGLVQLSERAMAWMRLLFLGTLVANGALLWRLRERTEQVLQGAEHAARELDLLAELLGRIEGERFSSPLLQALCARLEVDGLPPSRRIARLDRLMDLVHSRHSTLVRILSPFVLWDVHLSLALEGWRSTSGGGLRHWLAAVGQVEALISFATYHYERPEDVFPEILDGEARFASEALGHPLLPQDELVRNDLTLGATPRVLVVSGSNMSGKSTLLRTVGIAAVLAQAGAPVRARRLRMSPLAVGASIRIQDSLREGTSRFYTEIRRLQAIMERTGGAHPVLFLIDEMLHGTNSHDRRRGAEAIVRGLVDRGAIGLLTTHDLALAEIADALRPRAANVHFADHLEDGRMRFDYRIRDGVVRKSNALELMRSVGLDV